MRAKKSFGQNFIREPGVVDKIARLLPTEPRRVLELGAGLGALTFALLNHGHSVTAIERDRDLIPILNQLGQRAIDSGQLRVLEADAKAVDFAAELAQTGVQPKPDALPIVVGNVPYNLTGPLLRKVIALAAELERVVFLVQREVSDRLAAAPGSDDYGGLSVFAQAAFRVEPAFTVAKNVFYPAPTIDSRVVVLHPLRPPRAVETETFQRLVKAAFGQRRKTLRNAWLEVADRKLELLTEAAAAASVALEARGETLSVDDFARMAAELESRRGSTH